MKRNEQRKKQKEQKDQNIILNIKQHHLHQIIEQSPKKQEQVLHVLIVILNIKMSKHPIIDQRLKQKPDLHLIEIKTYHHSLQEITQNLHTNQKGKQEDQQIHKQRQKLKDHLLFKKINSTSKSRKNLNHDTEVDNNTDFKYWENKNNKLIK